MDEILNFFTTSTTLFGFDFQNWILAVGAIAVIWLLVLLPDL